MTRMATYGGQDDLNQADITVTFRLWIPNLKESLKLQKLLDL
jgi:hypothetical protein